MNCEGLYQVERFIHNLCPCFDIAFTQLGLITRTRIKFVEMVAVSERNLIMIDVQNKESKKQPLRM